MPKNPVTDPITYQEITFARLVLSGTMTDRQAAEAAGLNPDSAAYTKSKPRVRAYMLEHRAAVEQQLIDEDVDEQRRLKQTRDRVLARLWAIADLDFEVTRGSASAQVRALSIIVAIEGLIPDRHRNRRAATAHKPTHPTVTGEIYQAAWLRQQQEQNVDPNPTLAEQESAPEPQPAPASAEAPLPIADPTPLKPSQPASPVPRVPMADFVPDTRVPFSIKRNPFAHRR
jgi:hypothetical protein